MGYDMHILHSYNIPGGNLQNKHLNERMQFEMWSIDQRISVPLVKLYIRSIHYGSS